MTLFSCSTLRRSRFCAWMFPLHLMVVASGAATLQIYWTNSNGDSIEASNLDGTNAQTLIGLDSALGEADYRPSGITSDGAKLYWTDVNTAGVYSANLDGSGTALVIDMAATFSETAPQGITVSGGKLFVAGDANDDIFSLEVDGSNPLTLIDGSTLSPGLSSPLGMLNSGGKLYWSDSGNGGAEEIYFANLDGTSAASLLDTSTPGSNSPSGITSDGTKLYWADNLTGIYSANLDGTGAAQLITNSNLAGGNSPDGLTVHDGKLYWASSLGTPTDGIWTANVDGTGAERLAGSPGATPDADWLVIVPAVPEPSTMTLVFATGIAVFFSYRRRINH